MWLTDRHWVAAVIIFSAMILAAWRSYQLLTEARVALATAETERMAMQQALHSAQRMEALGRLAVGAAHDFNNHLTVISSNVEMVARRLDGTQEALRRHTDAAMQGVQRAAMLTGRLLSFSRQPRPEPELVDIDRLLADLGELLQRTVDDRTGLEVLPSREQWFTWADVNQMEHALLSLSVNARDRLPAGATLTIKAAALHLDAVSAVLHPASMAPGDYIQIDIGDSRGYNGPENWLPADDRTDADLSLAREFVRVSGGYLLRSDPAAVGLSLRLFLPRYTPPALKTPLPRRPATARPTILVVEDDAAVRAACVGVLRDLEYEVLEAPDAMEAFRVIADHGGIDLLFTDLGLPGGVSGRALADAARNVDAGMRVLFTTGYERIDFPDRAGTVLLRKPFTPAQLAAKVRDVLSSKRSAGQSETVQG
jgi:CheY-like chemotaxis protein